MKEMKIDVSAFIKKLEKRGITFYPAIMYVLMMCVENKEEEIFFEMPENLCLKTKFDRDFEVFYQNYARDCFESKNQTDIQKDKIFFALKENKEADFELYPLKKNGDKTVLMIGVNFETGDDFDKLVRAACLNF